MATKTTTASKTTRSRKAPARATTPATAPQVASGDVADAQADPKPSATATYTGSKAFAAVMLDAGVALATAKGLTARADRANHAVLIAGRKAEATKAAKAVDAMWAEAYEAFKAWKAERTEARREQRQTPEGQRQMLADERAFLAAHMAKAVA